MDGLAIGEGNDAKVPPQLWDKGPVSNAAIRLALATRGISNRRFAPLVSNVRPLPPDDIFEIGRRLQWYPPEWLQFPQLRKMG